MVDGVGEKALTKHRLVRGACTTMDLNGHYWCPRLHSKDVQPSAHTALKVNSTIAMQHPIDELSY